MQVIAIYRVAILTFSAALALGFNEPLYLLFVGLMPFFRQRTVKQELTDKLDTLTAQINLIVAHLLKK